MNVRLHRAGIELDARRFLTLEDALGTRVLCVAGELWITQDRDTDDYFVHAGECFTIDAPGRVVIQAQAPTRIALIEAAAPARTRWFARSFARWFGRIVDRWFGVARIDSAPNAIAITHGA
jgi:hypothetical protein